MVVQVVARVVLDVVEGVVDVTWKLAVSGMINMACAIVSTQN
jgi:hypothetical protein